MNILEKIADELKLKKEQVEKSVELLDEGNTIPFIARYRKEVTGNLTDELLRELDTKLNYYRNLEKRKEDVIRLIENQGKLDDELTIKIHSAQTLQEVEDIYLPFKPKKRTRATVAEEKGLRPLAEFILENDSDIEKLNEFAATFIDEELEVNSIEDAINYAKDIIAGDVSEDSDIRGYIRDRGMMTGIINCEKTDSSEENGVYSNYYDYSEKVRSAAAHRILAINRGEKEDQLRIKIDLEDDSNLNRIRRTYNQNSKGAYYDIIDEAIVDSYNRLILPQIQTQIRKELKEFADNESIKVFSFNLKPYLMQSPIKGRAIIGMDPGFRTGCKLAVISEFGEYLDSAQIFPVKPFERILDSKKKMLEFIEKYDVGLIALGNGTASRETEIFVVDIIREIKDRKIAYVIVNESGASIYSASELARQEFPDLDVTIRGAISIARRLQDPLAELVKIEPKHIGVGQYQHDVNQKELDIELEGVVESCVNTVGVDINTSSGALLKYVAGISAKIAENILEYKREKGLIKTKNELRTIKGIGPKTYEQCAGFIRIPESENPLDNTGVHPESYAEAAKVMEMDLDKIDVKVVSEDLGIGIPTLKDIIHELKKPGRDPRDEMPAPVLRSDVLTMDDLEEGMILTGTVRNVVDFGAFVDIGVGTDGLVHISEISNSFIKHPSDVLKVSDVVKVSVINIDRKREKIGLSIRNAQNK